MCIRLSTPLGRVKLVFSLTCCILVDSKAVALFVAVTFCYVLPRGWFAVHSGGGRRLPLLCLDGSVPTSSSVAAWGRLVAIKNKNAHESLVEREPVWPSTPEWTT